MTLVLRLSAKDISSTYFHLDIPAASVNASLINARKIAGPRRVPWDTPGVHLQLRGGFRGLNPPLGRPKKKKKKKKKEKKEKKKENESTPLWTMLLSNCSRPWRKLLIHGSRDGRAPIARVYLLRYCDWLSRKLLRNQLQQWWKQFGADQHWCGGNVEDWRDNEQWNFLSDFHTVEGQC